MIRLLLNLYAHARMRIGFVLADRRQRDVIGDDLLDAIGRKWCKSTHTREVA